jgi:hypothetical protein
MGPWQVAGQPATPTNTSNLEHTFFRKIIGSNHQFQKFGVSQQPLARDLSPLRLLGKPLLVLSSRSGLYLRDGWMRM